MIREPWMDKASDVQLHRRFVGPVQRWPHSADHQLWIVQQAGYTPESTVVDLGCGSLCAASRLIPWLNTGNYTGVDPRMDVVEEALVREDLTDVAEWRKASFVEGSAVDTPRLVEDGAIPHAPDLILMHSIFSHMRRPLAVESLTAMREAFAPTSVVVATFLISHRDDSADGEPWVYPGLVAYTLASVRQTAAQAGWRMKLTSAFDLGRPAQRWVRLSVAPSA